MLCLVTIGKGKYAYHISVLTIGQG